MIYAPVVGLYVLDGLAVVLEDVDAHHGAVEGGVRALDHLVIEMFTAGQTRKGGVKRWGAREGVLHNKKKVGGGKTGEFVHTAVVAMFPVQ